jgi:hypothetical protein
MPLKVEIKNGSKKHKATKDKKDKKDPFDAGEHEVIQKKK